MILLLTLGSLDYRPSSTPSEGTPQYSKAEISGTKGECAPYRLGCTVNLLNYFTSML